MTEYNYKDQTPSMSTASENHSFMMQLLDKTYDAAVSGSIPGADSAEDLARDYQNDYDEPLKAAEALVRWQNVKAGTSGFVTGLGGLITIPVALPANITSVIYVQIRMIAAIAKIGGYDLHDDRVKTLVFVCLAGNSAKDVLKTAGISVATAAAKGLIKQIPKTVIGQINKAVGFRLITKFGTKGAVNLGKAVPFIGGVLGAAMDAAATNAIGNVAIRTFVDESYD